MAAPLVLLHGGAHGAWCWEPLLPLLDGDALAVDLPPKSIRGGPGRFEDLPELQTLTLGDFADSALTDIDAAGFEHIVLVGHSMGGLTISEVACREPERIAHLVYVSCIVPPEGKSAMEALPEHLRDGSADLADLFCSDMDEEDRRFVLDRIGTEVGAVLHQPVTRAGIPPRLPKTFVKLLRDHALTPDHQDELIHNLRTTPGGDVDVLTIDAGHDVMISRPKELADVLNRIAGAVA